MAIDPLFQTGRSFEHHYPRSRHFGASLRVTGGETLTFLKIIFLHNSFSFPPRSMGNAHHSTGMRCLFTHPFIEVKQEEPRSARKSFSKLPPDNAARSAPLESAIAPSAASATDKGFTGGGSVVSYFNNKETIMKLAAIALASAFAISSTCAFAQTVRDKSSVTTHPMYRGTYPSVVSHPKYGNPYGNFSGKGNTDVWGHLGAYYGPMIPTGAGGR
jgi:hypothetical protein